MSEHIAEVNVTESTMNVTPYQSSEGGKKEQVEQMFDNISSKYDFLNRSLSFGIDIIWRKMMMRQLKDLKPQLILDVATGTADVAIEAVNLHPKHIIGVDISEGMLQVGREKILKKKLQHIIDLEKGDSENLRYADNSFDAVTVAFGVRNFENLQLGLSELHRVLKPQGKVVILEFSRPRLFIVKHVYDWYFRYLCPCWGKLISKDYSAYKYLYESVKAFPEGEGFTSIAEKAGFQHMKVKRVTLGIVSLYTAVK